MIDSSILARECAPEAPSVALTVRIRDLWIWTFEAVERSTAREPLIDQWARGAYRDSPGSRENHGLTSVTHELMTRGFRDGAFAARVHDGARGWRLPLQAFQGWKPDLDLEMTWTSGRLWQFETSEAFWPIADLGLPLLTTEAEADMYRRGVLQEIAAIEAASPRPPAARRTMLEQQIEAAEAAAPAPDPETQRDWVADWLAKARWPVREAVLWLALRDIDEVAKTVLTSFWAGNENEGIAGPHLAKCDIEGQSGWRRVVEPDPEPRMMQALRGGGLRASGLFEGAGPMAAIGAVQWENLTLGVAPKGQRGTSDAWQSAARINDQINGVPWRGHWVGICVEREDLFSLFPPIPIGADAADGADDVTAQSLDVGPVKRLGEATLEGEFKKWVAAQLDQNCLPDLGETYAFARRHGHTRQWARERLKRLPLVLRLSKGQRRLRPEISEEQRAAYLAYFGPV